MNNHLLLNSITFVVGFGFSLIVNRDIKPALLTGLIAVPASCAGVFVVNGKQRLQQRKTLTAFEEETYQLEEWRSELKQSISAIATEEQRIETNVNFLKIELSQLYGQVAEHRTCKQQLSRDVATLTTDKQRLEVQLQDLQTQVTECEQRREELHESLRSLRQEKQDELNRLQVNIIKLQNQKQELEEDLTSINEVKPRLQDNINEMQQFLVVLQTQILEYQEDKSRLEQELRELVKQKQEIITIEGLKRADNPSEPWNEFVMQLTKPELQVIKAILYQNDTRAEINKIAEVNITMPELLIDRINELALDTIGDLIIEPESGRVPPVILEDYLADLQQVLDKMNDK